LVANGAEFDKQSVSFVEAIRSDRKLEIPAASAQPQRSCHQSRDFDTEGTVASALAVPGGDAGFDTPHPLWPMADERFKERVQSRLIVVELNQKIVERSRVEKGRMPSVLRQVLCG
jgi:hypothetical protein